MTNYFAKLKAARHMPLMLCFALLPIVAAGQPVIPTDLALSPSITIATSIATADSGIYVAARPAVGTDGTNYLAVSKRSDFVSEHLVGSIVSSSGVAQEEFPITEPFNNHGGAALAFDGNNYLLVFHRGQAIFGIRISPTGQLLDAATGFLISTGSGFTDTNHHPDLAFDGENFLVVWQRWTNNQHDIYGARVSPAGQVLGEFPIFTATGEQLHAVVAFGMGNFLVLWRDTRNGQGPISSTDIYGARVSPQGVVLDPEGIAITAAPNAQLEPDVASDGENFLVVWLDERRLGTGPFDAEIFGARVSPEGMVLDGPTDTGGLRINSLARGYKQNPRACFDGRDFFVTWWHNMYESPGGVYAARVSTGGLLLDGPADHAGILIREPDCFACRVVLPDVASNGRTMLIPWINNAEAGGTFKDVFASLVIPKPTITDFEIENVAGSGRLTFETRKDQRYQLWASPDLAGWEKTGDEQVGTGSPLEVEMSSPLVPEQKFFSVEVLP